ncbi:TonB-dependent siderophore receptor [Marinomonas rhizomae]|uniref:Iron complex outermembrane receptor protein n=1 Tax=Marinomonas rhizomae TaxID=491948 RepID=A0A366JA05_9GAMM|nr:TonB-dependent siderophore receptor [Marinomonas rhizomae]RBP83782.1 iron complex outermembrane receptor protein [Marinomonas rhizomae]RNF73506.1 TonB-dependent siderophore receptor [Marinomonas rhizomae]
MTLDVSKKISTSIVLFSLLNASTGYALETHNTLPALVVEETGLANSTEEQYLEDDSSSATKSTVSVLETGQSISVITRKQMDDQNVKTVKEALNYTSGVLSTTNVTSRYDGVFIRGFGGFGTATRAVDFLDGLKLPRGQGFLVPSIEVFLLDRIDVLKGPSALLYGNTSPGGVVNQVSRSPDSTSYNEANIKIGTDNYLQGSITSQGTIDKEGEWQYSLTGVSTSAGSQYDGVSEERFALAPVITWTPDSKTQLTLSAFYQEDPEGGYFNSIYPSSLADSEYKSSLNRDLNVGDPSFDSYEQEQYYVGYALDHAISDMVSISSKARYFSAEQDFQGMQMSGELTSDGLLPRAAAHSIEDVESFVADNFIQLDFSAGGMQHTALAGLDYQQTTSNWEYLYGSVDSLDVTSPVYGITVGSLSTYTDSKQTQKQTGLYLQDQIKAGRLTALLGTRYDWTKQETENNLTDSTSKQSSGASSHRAGLHYLFDNNIAPYVSYSTSFEPTVGVDVDGNNFIPTEAEQWELGVKFEPSSMDALVTLSVFDITQQNVLTAGSTAGYYVQQGEVQSRGIELEARGKLSKKLELIGAITGLDTKTTESTVAANIGKRPQTSPEYYASLWANYMFFDGLSIGSGVRVVGSSYADDANTIKTDGYTLFDAKVSYNLGALNPLLKNIDTTLSISNVFDKEYYASCSYNYYCQYGDGRELLLTGSYKW